MGSAGQTQCRVERLCVVMARALDRSLVVQASLLGASLRGVLCAELPLLSPQLEGRGEVFLSTKIRAPVGGTYICVVFVLGLNIH